MPLLQPPQHGPHATFIGLFLNAVMEMDKRPGLDETLMSPATAKILEYIPVTHFASLMNSSGAEMLCIWDARTLFLNVDKFFDL